MNTPAPKGFAFPPFRETKQSTPADAGAASGASSPNAVIPADGKSEMFLRQAPVGAGLNALFPVYTTTKRWKGCDVWINVGDLVIPGPQVVHALTVALFAIVQGVRTLVATGRYSREESVQGLKTKQMIRYRGGIAEKFEVQFGINVLTASPATIVQFAIMATDEALSVGEAEVEEAGTILIAGLANGFAQADTDVAPLELRGVVASSAVALVAGTPRWLHVHDLATGGNPDTHAPLFSWSLTSGGGTFFARPTVTHRFTSGIMAVISSTAAVTTSIGVEDSAVQRLAYR